MLVLAAAPLSAQVPDTIILRSGNPVVGEVESLRRGTLSFDTDEMGVVGIDWDDVALLTSSALFEVTLVSGEMLLGSLQSADTAVLVIVGPARADTVPFGEVVQIGSIETGFLARTNGFIDVGTNLARANRMASILADGQFRYRSPKWEFEVTAESYWQQQESISELGDTTTQETTRTSTSLAVSRILGGRWAVTGAGSVEENQELNLDLRFLAFAGGAYQIIRNQGLELSATAGGTLNSEEYAGEGRNATGEILAQLRFDAFDVGDLDLYTNLSTYTHPGDEGRFRADLDARVAYEIIDDFTFGINITESYDSRPPSESAPKRDFQYSFSIGWNWS
jgi:hypothetical protein